MMVFNSFRCYSTHCCDSTNNNYSDNHCESWWRALGTGGAVIGAGRVELRDGLLTQVAVTEVALQGACPPALLWAGDTGCIWWRRAHP